MCNYFKNGNILQKVILVIFTHILVYYLLSIAGTKQFISAHAFRVCVWNRLFPDTHDFKLLLLIYFLSLILSIDQVKLFHFEFSGLNNRFIHEPLAAKLHALISTIPSPPNLIFARVDFDSKPDQIRFRSQP